MVVEVASIVFFRRKAVFSSLIGRGDSSILITVISVRSHAKCQKRMLASEARSSTQIKTFSPDVLPFYLASLILLDP